MRLVRASARRGFTLLELVMVMLVITIALGIVAPTLTGFRHGSEVDGAARQLVALTQWGRSQAVSKGQTYVMRYVTTSGATTDAGEAAAGEWQVMSAAEDQGVDASGAPVTTTSSQNSLARLATKDAIRVELTSPSGQAIESVGFYADGSMTPARFRLSGLESEKWVVCASRAEGFRVVKDPAEVPEMAIVRSDYARQ